MLLNIIGAGGSGSARSDYWTDNQGGVKRRGDYFMSERRTSVRIPLLLQTVVERETKRYPGRIRDVSSGGCFISTKGELAFGDIISVESRLSNGEVFKFRGKVLHARPGQGFGMCFINMAAEEQKALEQLIEEHRIWESLWCGVPVIVNESVPGEEFIMPYFDTDPEQQPSFTVTQATLRLVASRSDEYVPIIKSMVEEWRKGKERFLREAESGAVPMQPLDSES